MGRGWGRIDVIRAVGVLQDGTHISGAFPLFKLDKPRLKAGSATIKRSTKWAVFVFETGLAVPVLAEQRPNLAGICVNVVPSWIWILK